MVCWTSLVLNCRTNVAYMLSEVLTFLVQTTSMAAGDSRCPCSAGMSCLSTMHSFCMRRFCCLLCSAGYTGAMCFSVGRMRVANGADTIITLFKGLCLKILNQTPLKISDKLSPCSSCQCAHGVTPNDAAFAGFRKGLQCIALLMLTSVVYVATKTCACLVTSHFLFVFSSLA